MKTGLVENFLIIYVYTFLLEQALEAKSTTVLGADLKYIKIIYQEIKKEIPPIATQEFVLSIQESFTFLYQYHTELITTKGIVC